MTPEEKYELFDKYCSNELSEQEQQLVKQLMQEDVSFADELLLYQEVNTHLQTRFDVDHEQRELESNLNKIRNSYNNTISSEKNTRIIRIPAWAYAVAASVVIAFGVYFFDQKNPVYQDFANIPELSIAERGSMEEDSKNAENAFNSKKYQLAEGYLLSLLSKDKKNTKYQFYLGITLLEQGKHAKATDVFKQLYLGDSVFKYKAIWLEALNQLKQKKYDKTIELLKTVPEEAEDYEQAQQLLSALS
ncbi:tol-pal system YbgF family protein [Aquimarina sp. I32.4]|uniref:tetratricopeptide repeat protein n=1 Tax=Aquimarina sp. I32.4 TaxID=2053903 RepID=UPI000CDE7131|nr:hypothetical protein [Aquimarina sp. I32.4]